MFKNNLAVVSIISSISILSGCLGGGSSDSTAPPVTYSAATYFVKTAVGNTWTLTGTTTETGIYNSSGTLSDVYRNTAFSNGVQTQTDTTITNGVAGTPSTTTYSLASDGSFQGISGSITEVNLPGTFSVGTTWAVLPASATRSVITGVIQAVGVSCSSNSQTFTDCLKINYSYSENGTGTSNGSGYTWTAPVSTTFYYSPTVGQTVQYNETFTATYSGAISGQITWVYTEQLQAGFIAQ